MTARVLVVGRNSFLAREFAARHGDVVARAIGHGEAGDARPYEGATCVVNFAFAPALHDAEYDPALDIDLVAARRAQAAGARYVMISSRRVYGEAAQWNAAETGDAPGRDAYGRNKARIERSLAALLGERLTVLRPGNAVGYEPEPGRRRFAAYLLDQLRAGGRIRLTVSPGTRRDLVPVEFLCRAVRAAAVDARPGVYNVGAGRATAVGDAARWLIEGFGAGDIVDAGGGAQDEFLLDSAKLARSFGLACAPGGVEAALKDAGRRLAKALRR